MVDAGAEPSMRWVAEDLHARGVRRLLVEGGGSVQGQLLAEDLADELHLVLAPVLVGDPRAARFAGAGLLLGMPRAVTLVTVQRIDECVLLTYALSERYPSVASHAVAAASGTTAAGDPLHAVPTTVVTTA